MTFTVTIYVMLYFSWHFWLWGFSFLLERARCVPVPPARQRSPLQSLPYGAALPLGDADGTLHVARLLRLAVHRGWPRRGGDKWGGIREGVKGAHANDDMLEGKTTSVIN